MRDFLAGLDDTKEQRGISLIAAIGFHHHRPPTTAAFVTVSLKYSKFGSTTIQDIAKSAVTVDFLNEQAIAKRCESRWRGRQYNG